MNATDYQYQAARTLIEAPETPFTADELQIMLGAIDLCVKAGKVAEYVKKAICHRHGYEFSQFEELVDTLAIEAMQVIRNAARPEKAPDLTFSGREQMMLWCALGLGGESGEVLESVAFDTFDQDVIGKELGDQHWYAAALCTLTRLDMSDVLAANIAKLERRYPNGYSSADSKARIDTKPRSDTLPIGTRATCQACGQPIEWINPYWRHFGVEQPRHIAMPVEYAL